jgi:hypothetical protein
VSDVSPPAALDPLATVEDVKTLAGPELDVDPARCERLLEMASATVRGWTYQTISQVIDDGVIVISEGGDELVLAERPVLEVSFVQVEHDEPVYAVSWDSFGHLRRRDGLGFGRRGDHVAVTYSHGWDPVPDGVVALVAAKVAGFLAAGDANPGNLKNLQVGAMSESYGNAAGTDVAIGPGALTQAEKTALTRYRLGSLAAAIGPP